MKEENHVEEHEQENIEAIRIKHDELRRENEDAHWEEE